MPTPLRSPPSSPKAAAARTGPSASARAGRLGVLSPREQRLQQRLEKREVQQTAEALVLAAEEDNEANVSDAPQQAVLQQRDSRQAHFVNTDVVAAASLSVVLGVIIMDLAVDWPLLWAAVVLGQTELPAEAVTMVKTYYNYTLSNKLISAVVALSLVVLVVTLVSSIVRGIKGPYKRVLGVLAVVCAPLFALAITPAELALVQSVGEELALNAKLIGGGHVVLVSVFLYALCEFVFGSR